MSKLNSLGIPSNFEQMLPKLKNTTLKWETVCYSGTKINQSTKIQYFTSFYPGSYGNIVLSPGLGTNTDIDPLMKMITFWALTHRYNIITFDTFLGNFYNNPSYEMAQKNTYPEFIASLESCIKFTEPYSIKQPTILIGHSAGATGMIEALNNMIAQKEKIHLQSVILFAPWTTEQWHNYLKDFIGQRSEKIVANSPKKFLPIPNMFDSEKTGMVRYMPIMPDFLTELNKSPFRPDLMNKWGTNITIVLGEKDKKVSPETVYQRYEELTKTSHNKNFLQFIVLPEAKHSFVQLYKNKKAIIELLKSQRILSKPN